MRIVGALVLFVSAVACAAPPMENHGNLVAQAKHELALAWKKLDARTSDPLSAWSMEVTPPIPDRASGTTPTPAVIYGYATRFQNGLADGIRVGRVWGMARILSSGALVSVERTSDKLVDLAIQGVSPARMPWPSDADRDAAYRWVIDGAAGTPPPVVAATYCPWYLGNRVIAESLPMDARAFLHELHCPK